MERLLRHFRRAHDLAIGERTALRLLRTVRGLKRLDPLYVLAVTGFDLSAMTPRRVDVTLGELRGALGGRSRVA